jgi:O-methyltransferase
MHHRLDQFVTTARAWLASIYWRFLRKSQAAADCLFPSSMIHPNAAWIASHWDKLQRGCDDEEWRKQAIRRISGHSMVTYDGALSLLDQVKFCEMHNIAGDYVELGTWKGGCIALMAMANLRSGSKHRTIHGFDSFRGMPERNPDFDNDASAANLAPGSLAASATDVRSIVQSTGYPSELLVLHEGWFENTVPAANIKNIAILRIDGDFYGSYKIALENFWEKVTPGGFVIFDDWVFAGCRQAVAEFFASRNIKSYICFADATVRYVQIPPR